MRLKIYSMVILSAIFMSGCSLLNPFASNFKCPNMVDGKCQPISQSYKNSLSDPGTIQQEEAGEKQARKNGKANKKNSVQKASKSASAPQEEISIAGRPLREPGKEMRIKIYKYVDKDILYGSRFIYVEARKPQWLLDVNDK